MATVADLRAAGGVLTWDRQTYMPSGGVESRAEQLATLSRLAHETLAAPETARLLDAAEEYEPGSDDAALVRLARREHERAVTNYRRAWSKSRHGPRRSRSRSGCGRVRPPTRLLSPST